jgi:ubiquitin-protein ligase
LYKKNNNELIIQINNQENKDNDKLKNKFLTIGIEVNKPQYMIIDDETDIKLLEFCENINLNIDKYEFIEDLVIEIKNFLTTNYLDTLNDNKKSEFNKNLELFEKKLEEKKDIFIKNNIDNKELNGDLKLFSLRTCVEMLGDQIKKIYQMDNFNVNIDNFPDINILMTNFTFRNANDLIIDIDMKINLNLLNKPPKIIINSNKILKDNILSVISQLKPFRELKSWSIRYSINETIINIYNMINTFGEIKLEFSSELASVINDLEYLISIRNENISEIKLLELFDKELLNNKTNDNIEKISSSKSSDTKTYWKKGTGYGHSGNKSWDIDSYIENINKKKTKIKYYFGRFILLFNQTFSVKNSLENTTDEYFDSIINLLNYWIVNEDVDDTNIIIVCDVLYNNLNILNKTQQNEKVLKLLNYLRIYLKDNQLVHKLFEKQSQQENILDKLSIKKISNDPFVNIFENQMFVMYQNEFSNFYYKDIITLDSEKLSRLKKEFNIIKKSLYVGQEASIFFWVEKNSLNKMRFIISGPTNTPYDCGLYIFDMTLKTGFPNTPPQVHFSNNGNQRFNPNLYNCGKVCLSLLGTWRGDKGENWNSSTSSFIQVIISIQSQILIEEPFYNEPGYESLIGKAEGIRRSKEYNDDIRQYNLDHAINDLILGVIDKNKSNYSEFDYIIKNYFRLKKDKILENINKWKNDFVNNSSKLEKFNKSINKFIELSNKL